MQKEFQEYGRLIRVWFYALGAILLTVVTLGVFFSALVHVVEQHMVPLFFIALSILYLVAHWEQIKLDTQIDLLAVVKRVLDYQDLPDTSDDDELTPFTWETPEVEQKAENWWKDVRQDVIRFLENGVTPLVVSHEAHNKRVEIPAGHLLISNERLQSLLKAEEQLAKIKLVAEDNE